MNQYKGMENFINALFLTIVALTHSNDLDSATMYFEQLKTILRKLSKQGVVYTRNTQVDRLGDLIIALNNNMKNQSNNLMKQEWKFDGKLVNNQPISSQQIQEFQSFMDEQEKRKKKQQAQKQEKKTPTLTQRPIYTHSAMFGGTPQQFGVNPTIAGNLVNRWKNR